MAASSARPGAKPLAKSAGGDAGPPRHSRKRLERYRYLAKRTAISPDVVDEEEQSLVSAQAAEESAQVAVRKAQADCKEKEASREAALAEVKLKEALIVVAFQDLERSRALADYARITAPFDGVITRRNIDPGAFVQNSTTAMTESLMTVARNDIVTVGMKVPDNAAPFITRNTEAEIQMDDLPGVTILGRVTRFSPCFCARPLVTPKAPPAATSSPSRCTAASRASSSSSARRRISMKVCSMAQPVIASSDGAR